MPFFGLLAACRTRAGASKIIAKPLSFSIPARRAPWRTPWSPGSGVPYLHTFTFSRHIAPEVCKYLSPSEKQRAQGMPDARCTRDLMRNV
jgi:hypothetical protein